MALLVTNRLMPTRRRRQRRRRRRNRHRYGSIAKLAKRKCSPSQQDDDSQGAKRMRNSGMLLTKDIWRHIHCLMPMRDAARVACVSRAFLNSWLCYPNLTFNVDTLGLDEHVCETDFISKVDHIIKRHSGICVKTFKLEVPYELDVCEHVDRWLQFAITPAIEELTLMLYGTTQKYNFPCSLLSDGIADSIRFLDLGHCTFRPTVEHGSWRSLKRLCLSFVRITEDELGCILLNSLALEGLELRHCDEIVSLKIPSTLQQLSYLTVSECSRVRAIENKAPNVSSFYFTGNKVKLSLGEWLQVKKLSMLSSRIVRYACATLPSMMPNVETLSIGSLREVYNTPMLPTKFPYLKYLSISLIGLTNSPAYDYLSLVSFLAASPFLATFFLAISQQQAEQESIFGSSSLMRQISEHRHEYLKRVTINGFCSAKSMIELTCHILENAVSLEHLTLNLGLTNRFEHSPGILKEVPKALSAIQTYIAGKVPSTVRLSVLDAKGGLIAKSAKRKHSYCQQDDGSQGGKRMRDSVPTLPEDIWCHIHSLMPMRDAARVACASRAFLSSWRCHLKLTFNEYILGLDGYISSAKLTTFLKNTGIGVKAFKLQVPYELDVYDHVDRWLQFAITPRIEELNLMLYGTVQKYNFPCSLLSDGIANSIRFLDLGHCPFRPTVKVGSWRSLKRLCLSFVHITGDELGCVLSNSFALEWLELRYCDKIASLKIPCTLQRLSYLKVSECSRMRVIESKAPKVSNFYFTGYKVVNTPMLTSKFLYLKYLSISLSGLTVSPSYDYFSLVSFLDASPFLETFLMTISKKQMERESTFGDLSHMRQIPEHRHEYLKSMTINGFCSTKSLVELTCHILENAVSLECLTLNTTLGLASSFEHSPGTCFPMGKAVLMEVPKVLSAIQTYIVGKVPSTRRPPPRRILLSRAAAQTEAEIERERARAGGCPGSLPPPRPRASIFVERRGGGRREVDRLGCSRFSRLDPAYAAMALLALNRLISIRRARRRRRNKARKGGSIAKSVKRMCTPCQKDDDSKMMRISGLTLPEDIWSYILSLMPMRDAARAACVSRVFLRSWRCHPNLTFNKNALGLNDNACETDFTSKVDHILKNHSGSGLKRFKLSVNYKLDNCDYINSWLQFAMTSGIEELTLMLSGSKPQYNFPCSLFSDRIANSIRCLELAHCAFHPTTELGSLRNLKRLHLSCVRISGDELAFLLSNSFALEQLGLKYSKKIVSLKMPCVLQRLNCLEVYECKRVQVIESKAPNLSSFSFIGNKVKLSLGESSQVKNLYMCSSNIICYARSDLPSIVPNVETLAIASHCEMVDTPMLPTKFLYLKHLTISLSAWTFSRAYDYFSLIYQESMEHETIFESSSHLRQMPGYCHEHLRSVTICGFCSAKSLVELTCHIVEMTNSLECLTLDTTHGDARCSGDGSDECFPVSQGVLTESPRALLAIRGYIQGKIPSKVKLNVLEPCSRCHAAGG
uniref:F-box domain-containing protein n=1 Tax=Oryza punctata TaxID=4537 RepID=A0A0E0M313_ORYPU